MQKIRRELNRKGYILVIICGGITGDIKNNDTHCHHNLESKYREYDIQLMLKQLRKIPAKILSLLRDEMMPMTIKLWDLLQINTHTEFKSLFLTNVDGS